MSSSARVVVVVGASSGIGRAVAIACSRRGDHVVLAARAEASLRAAERECVGTGDTLVVPMDVTDRETVDALLTAAVDRFGRVDAVVDSVAVVAYGRFEDVPAETFDRVIATTLTGTANLARASLRLFKEQGGGSLVVVGSLLGKIATPYLNSYVCAKWAVHGLVRSLQVEARETPGIGISLVSPGGVDTPVYTQGASYLGFVGRPPPPVDPPEKVARAVLRAIDRPRRERSVGPANHLVVLGFRTVPAVFDALVLPLMKVGGLSRDEVAPNDGNVFAPRPEADAVHGRWGRHWLRAAGAATAVGATAGAAALLATRRRP